MSLENSTKSESNIAPNENQETQAELTPQAIFETAKMEASSLVIDENNRNEKGELLVFAGGPVSKLSEEYWKLVRTPSFRKWFGDSNVVDQNGEPARVYHRTEHDLDSFDSFSKENKQEGNFDPGHYFSSGNVKMHKNRLSVFVNAKVKKAETFAEIHRFTEADKQKLNQEGYDGIVYELENARKELDEMKEKFKQKYNPEEIKDYIFYGFNKLKSIFNEHTSNLEEQARYIKGKEQFIQTLENPLYQLVIFDGNNVMIVKKEENHTID